MKYFFILGSNSTLSIAELAAVFPDARLFLTQPGVATVDIDREINANIIKKIGGTIKFGLIHHELASASPKDILNSLAFAVPQKSEGKYYFGFSFYGKSKLNMKVLGMEFKKLLKQNNISSRWVTSIEPTLSSVVVEQNKLVSEKGAEIVMIEFNKKLLIGKTLAVQPFKELSFRDYGRPARDDRSGMLPPKLAQIMINLAIGSPLEQLPLDKGGRGDFKGGLRGISILDPFCGSGTILTEAALMGYVNLIGTDISSKALEDTKTNLEWMKKNFQFSIFNFQLINSNSTQISKHLSPNSVDTIITEPYLGPQRGAHDINKTIKELEKLYSDSLREFSKILKPSGRIVMIWPVFMQAARPLSLRATAGSEAISQTALSTKSLHPNLNDFTITNPIPQPLQNHAFIKLTNRPSIIYGRDGQKVWREIVVLEKYS